MQQIPLRKGVLHDFPSTAHDGRHAGAESRPEYANLLSAAGLPVRTPFRKSPEQLGPEQIRDYQVYRTNEKKLAPGSVLIAVAALRFLYKVSLRRNWIFGDVIPVPKKPQTLPVVLSPEEVLQFLGCVRDRKHHAILTTCYAAGLRISEAVRLIVPDIDSARMVIRVDQGKGRKTDT